MWSFGNVGANIGYYVLIERKILGDTGHIVGIEPSPQNVALLRRNVALNEAGNVTIIDVSGNVTLSDGAEQLRDKVKSVLQQGHKNVLVNLERVSYMDSAGLGELVQDVDVDAAPTRFAQRLAGQLEHHPLPTRAPCGVGSGSVHRRISRS